MCRDRFLSFALVLVIGFFLLVSLMLSATLAHVAALVRPRGLDPSMLMNLAHQVCSYGLFTLLFGLIFRVLPDAQVAWRHVWLGAATTTTLFVAGKGAFGVYLGHTTVGAGFGAAGSLVIVILWTYYSTLILLLGAEITQVQSKLAGLDIVPSPIAIHVTEHDRVQEGRPHADTIIKSARDANALSAGASRSLLEMDATAFARNNHKN
jgi:membrane protein